MLARKVLSLGVLTKINAVVRGRRVLDDYARLMARAWDEIADFVPADTRSILDIGCGIGGIHEHSMRALSSPIELFLADRNQESRSVFYGFEQVGAVYNDLDLTESYLRSRRVDGDRIRLIDLDVEPLPDDREFDCVISLLSWGFHYPVEEYDEYVFERLASGGRAILDVRKGTGGREALERRFRVETIRSHEKFDRVFCEREEGVEE